MAPIEVHILDVSAKAKASSDFIRSEGENTILAKRYDGQDGFSSQPLSVLEVRMHLVTSLNFQCTVD